MPFVTVEGRIVWVESIDEFYEGRPPAVSTTDLYVEGREVDDSDLKAKQYAEELGIIESQFDTTINHILYRSQNQGNDAANYLVETLGIPFSLATLLLPGMIATLCARLDLVFAFPDYLKMVTHDQAVNLHPAFYGGVTETPQYFNDMVSAITGLEGYELSLFVDEIYSNVNTLCNIPQFVKWYFTEESGQAWIKTLVKVCVIVGFIAVIGTMMSGEAFANAQVSYNATLTQGASKLAAMKAGISTFLETMKVSIGTFLKAIHYDTILNVHQIAYLVSQDYREMVTGVYNEIAQFSGALGLDTTFILSSLQNARAVVLSTSTLMGRKYDMAEITWLATFQGYLKTFQTRAYRYRNNPGAVLYDLDQLIMKDAIDTQGLTMRSILESINEVSVRIQATVSEIIDIRDSVNEFVADLPSFIRKELEPKVKELTGKFDEFIREKYDPLKREFNTIVMEIGLLQINNTSKVSGLIERLKNPGDYLAEIDKFASWEKIAQERKVADIASRQLGRDVDVIKGRSKELSTELRKVTQAVEAVTLTPLTMPAELEGLSRPIGGKVKEHTTWYVGDY